MLAFAPQIDSLTKRQLYTNGVMAIATMLSVKKNLICGRNIVNEYQPDPVKTAMKLATFFYNMWLETNEKPVETKKEPLLKKTP